MTPLERAAKSLLKHGCFSKEASEITGYSRYSLLDMHKNNDKRVSTVVIGREILFDRAFLSRMKKQGNQQAQKE